VRAAIGYKSDGESVQGLLDGGRSVSRLGPRPCRHHESNPWLSQPQSHVPGCFPAHQETHGRDSRREAVRLFTAVHLRQVRGVLPKTRKGFTFVMCIFS